jgi:hypothetical protein
VNHTGHAINLSVKMTGIAEALNMSRLMEILYMNCVSNWAADGDIRPQPLCQLSILHPQREVGPIDLCLYPV